MENDGHLSASHAAQFPGTSDGAGLLSARRNPGLIVTTAMEPSSSYRSMHSRQNSAVEEMVPSGERHSMRDQLLTEQEWPGTRVRKPSPGPSAVTSIIRRMTTLRSPLSRTKFRSTKRAQGSQYATLDEGDDGVGDRVTVDLSTLEGLGFELHDMPGGRTQRLDEEDTQYVRAGQGSDRPDFRSFAAKTRSVGDGMKDVGAQLTTTPSRMASRLQAGPSSAYTASSLDRTKTVRNIGQSLAQEKNTIVVVKQPMESMEPMEQVDLSSLEGSHRISQRASQTFETMNNRAGMLPEETQSYFFPQDPDIPNWKPVSMHSGYILSLTVLAITIAGVQEYLCQKSLRRAGENGGILTFNQVAEISTADFFAWKYLPTMVAIVYSVFFSIMDFDIRRLEPYYQLSQPSGARAAASLNLDHLTMFQYFIPFKALQLKQWAVFFSTTGNIVASMVGPAVQNPSLVMVSNKLCPNGGCQGDEKQFLVQVQPVWSRLLSGSYLVVAIVTLILFLQLRRKSGLLSDPKGIAGIASMATKSHILHDFTDLDQATRGEIHRRLQHRQFILYKSSIWQGEWMTKKEEIRESERRLRSPHPLMLRVEAAVPFLAFMFFLLVTIPLISLTAARVVPNAVPWLPVLLATLLKLLFSTFESDVRLMEPFYQLSLGNATPQNSLTLDYQATVYGWMPFKAMYNRHWLVALVGFASVALDVLTVTVSSFSVNSAIFLHKTEGDASNQDQTFISFWVSLILSIVILVFVIVTTLLVYIRRGHPFLPREPSTIAAVLAFIYASNMLTDFIDTERLTNKQMEQRLKKLGKKYGLGWFRGRDGQIHCAIDEEPMRSRYVHGKPYTMAQAGPLQPHETFYSV